MAAKGSTPHALLGLLTFHAMSGYDVRQLIPESIGHFWSDSYGNIYPALKDLSARGFVTKRTHRKKGKPDRHVYALTQAGREELGRWLAVPVEAPAQRNELLLKLFFGANAAPAVSRDHVVAHRMHNAAALKLYDQIVNKLKEEEIEDPQLPFWLITLSYGRHTCAAVVEWCDETLREMEGWEKS